MSFFARFSLNDSDIVRVPDRTGAECPCRIKVVDAVGASRIVGLWDCSSVGVITTAERTHCTTAATEVSLVAAWKMVSVFGKTVPTEMFSHEPLRAAVWIISESSRMGTHGKEKEYPCWYSPYIHGNTVQHLSMIILPILKQKRKEEK
jgi:hypothetical protein